MEAYQSVAGLAVLLLFFVYSLWTGRRRKGNQQRQKPPPQPAGALPVIGHLHLLKDQDRPLAQTLGDMADKYGPVFMLRLGFRRTLVVSSTEAARECFTTNDRALATRPRSAAGDHMGYKRALIGFAPYGPYWRSVRRIATVELLSPAKVQELKPVRSAEVDACIKDLYGLWVGNGRRPVKVEMKRWLGDLSYNVVVRAVAGKRYFGSAVVSDEAWRFRKAVSQFFSLLGSFVPSDMFPFLKWMPLVDVGGHEGAMKSAAREMDSVLTGLLEEHRMKKLGSVHEPRADFMDVMLSVVGEDPELSKADPDTAIKATSLALIMGGTDTTTVSLIWTLAALLNNRWALEKVQEEVEACVGGERAVEESDIKNLVYLQAVVKEAFRLHPVAELLVPHEAMEDCSVGGYHVPAGTRVLVNAWKLQRDPGVWAEDPPCEFRPERFLLQASTAGVDVRGKHLELIPFGSGRRACPGISFALQVMHLALARLIQGFQMETPGNRAVEMSDGRLGTTAANSPPLEVVITPRLSARLYGVDCSQSSSNVTSCSDC